MRGAGSFPFYLTQTAQGLAQDFRLDAQLCFGGKMLVLATSAAAEIGAFCLDAFGRGLQYAKWAGEDDAFLPADFFHQDAFARQNEWRKNGVTSVEAKSFAAID